MGRKTEAETLSRQVLTTRMTRLGAQHPSTAAAADNLALVLLEQGKLPAAQHVLEETWPSRLAWLERQAGSSTTGGRGRFEVDARAEFSLLAVFQPTSPALRTVGFRHTLIVKDAPRDSANSQATSSTSSIVADIGRSLGDAVLIEFVSFDRFVFDGPDGRWQPAEPRYGAYTLRSNGAIAWFDLGDANAIDALLEKYRRVQTATDARAEWRAAATELDARVFRPIRVASKDAKTFRIAPVSALRGLPFAALLDEQGLPILQTYTIQMVASGRDLLRTRSQ